MKAIFNISKSHVSLPFYVVNSSSHPIHVNSAIVLEIMLKLASFSSKITINGQNCHWRISRFIQMLRSEIIFTLDSRNFGHNSSLLFMPLRFYLDSIFANCMAQKLLFYDILAFSLQFQINPKFFSTSWKLKWYSMPESHQECFGQMLPWRLVCPHANQ